MKEKVYGLRTSLIITILSLCAALIIKIGLKQTDITDFMYDIMMGVFSGSVLTVLIYMTEYRAIKKNYLENYYIKSIESLGKIGRLKYFDFSDENNLLLEYKREYEENKSCGTNKNDAKLALIEYWERFEGKRDDLENYLIRKVDKVKNEIEDVIKSYIELSKFKYRDTEDAYSNLYFFVNQKPRIKIYNEIHDVQRKLLKNIKEVSAKLEFYRNTKGYNLLIVVDYLEKIQNKLFYTEIKYNSSLRTEVIHKKYCEEMEQTIENFRAGIYKVEPQIMENQIIFSCSTIIK